MNNLKLKSKILLCLAILAVIGTSEQNSFAKIAGADDYDVGVRGANELNERLFVTVGLCSAAAVVRDLNAGAHIHAADANLQTPLHFAIRRIFEARFIPGSLEVLDALLEYGADPDFCIESPPGTNTQTAYEYFEEHYSNYTDQVLVAAVRERLNNYRVGVFAPERRIRRLIP